MVSRSSPSEVTRLVADLESADTIRRAAAVARLRVIGERAIPRLAGFIDSDAPVAARALAVSALQDLPHAYALDVALGTLDDREPDIVVAALAVLREWVAREDGTRALEAVTAVAVDDMRAPRVRAAAIDALSDLPAQLIKPLRDRAPRPEREWSSLDDPASAREWVDAHGATASPSILHALIERLQALERDESAAAARVQWRRARGLAHRMLARRGSRLALYDLRDSFETAREPLPDDFLMAVETLGDASCLEPLARAWAIESGTATWRAQLSTAAAAIAKRTRLTGRSAAMKRLRAQWPGFL